MRSAPESRSRGALPSSIAQLVHELLRSYDLHIPALLQHTEAQKILLINLVEDGDRGRLDDFVIQVRPSCAEIEVVPRFRGESMN